jgi:hypothetical protein
MVVWAKFIYTSINEQLGANPLFQNLMQKLVALLAQARGLGSISQEEIMEFYPYLPLTVY